MQEYHLLMKITLYLQYKSTTGNRLLKLTLNNTLIIGVVSSILINMDTRLNISTTYKLNVGDYIEVAAYQNSGSAIDVKFADKTSPVFGMVKVG